MKNQNTLVEAILDTTNGGWDYFTFIYPDLLKARTKNQKCRLIKNHRRGDRNPSLSYYFNNDRWCFRDFGDPDFSGDIFTLYGIINNIDDFPKILEGLRCDFNVEYSRSTHSTPYSSLEEVNLPQGETFNIETLAFENLSTAEINFLEKFQITEDAMLEFNSKFLSAYSFISSKGKQYRKKKQPDEVIIGHSYRDTVKIYSPYSKKYKYRWLGDKKGSQVYGIQYLRNLADRFKYEENSIAEDNLQIILCAGEKDTLVARSLGLHTFCLNSETITHFPEELYLLLKEVNKLYMGNFQLKIVYDLDDAGKKFASRIKEIHGNDGYDIDIVNLPNILAENGGKDIADWMALNLPKEDLLKAITSVISPISPISPTSVNVEVDDEKKITESTLALPKSLINEIPQDVFQRFPKLLRDALEPFEFEFKTMMTLAFITSLGAITTNVKANFRRDKLYPNLYSIIIAPPASGKSLIKWARKLVMPIEKFLDSRSKKHAQKYQQLLEQVEKGKLSKSEIGEEPPYQLLFIPADITSAMLLKQASDNGGEGLMFDSEIDGLVQSNQGNLRSFTDFLRKNYEGEPISVMRKTNREHITIEEGKMSLLLSGTPGQFIKLIPDAENGLFSRVIPYNFIGSDEWQPAFEPNAFDLDSYFEELSESVLNYYRELEAFPEPIIFSLSNEQLIRLDKVFSQYLKEINFSAGIDGGATVKRLAPIVIKIAMILSMLRRFENGQVHNQNSCHPDDFDNSMIIAEVILSHVLSTLRMMKDERIETIFRGIRRDYFYALPEEFSYRQSQHIAEELGIKLKTAEKWVHGFRNKGFLINPEKGQYKKVA